jgi:hypothetical protein
MSRAKQALLLFCNDANPPEEDKCPNFPQLLCSGLGRLDGFGSGFLGNPLWHKEFVSAPQESNPDTLPTKITLPPRPSALEKFLPSDEGKRSLTGTEVFSERNAMKFGIEIHQIFEGIDWLDKTWQATGDLSMESAAFISNCVGKTSVKILFTKPSGDITLWREKPFDLFLDQRWISGCFDRVVIRRDASGKAISAELIDFKTDQCSREELINKYFKQLESYRSALSTLLKIPDTAITMILLHLSADEPVVRLS